MGKSSKDKRDAYYRLAKEQGWRARSAFKLLQLDEEFDLFEGVTRVVDLCAAPGSWSQVLSRVLIKGEKFGRAAWTDKMSEMRLDAMGIEKTNPQSNKQSTMPDDTNTTAASELEVPQLNPRANVKIVAIDLQPISPLPGIVTLKADITAPSTIPLLLSALDPDYDPATASPQASHPVDLVLSDGAPDVTGLHDLDTYIQSQLLFAALNLARRVLKPGGKFVAKVFRAKDVDLTYAQLRVVFDKVTVAKPRSSRASSVEAFVVCEGFKGDVGRGEVVHPYLYQSFEASSSTTPHFELLEEGQEEAERSAGWIAPFLACGDLSAWDSDASYRLPKDRVVLDPVQPPTAPPYKRALEMRRLQGGAYGKTKGMFPSESGI